jgi:predicted amidophosphoribosyltransferase
MIVICPSCRAPSNTSEAHCWVCRRHFDGSEPVIGDVPDSRRPYRLSDVQRLEEDRVEFDVAPWRRVRTG